MSMMKKYIWDNQHLYDEIWSMMRKAGTNQNYNMDILKDLTG